LKRRITFSRTRVGWCEFSARLFSPLLAMFDVDPQIPVRRGIAFELVGDQHARRATMFPEQLAHEPPGRVPVAPALHQHVEILASDAKIALANLYMSRRRFTAQVRP
jgi:hypothetical protein